VCSDYIDFHNNNTPTIENNLKSLYLDTLDLFILFLAYRERYTKMDMLVLKLGI